MSALLAHGHRLLFAWVIILNNRSMRMFLDIFISIELLIMQAFNAWEEHGQLKLIKTVIDKTDKTIVSCLNTRTG